MQRERNSSNKQEGKKNPSQIRWCHAVTWRVGWWWISARLNTRLLFRRWFFTAWADFSRPKQLFFKFLFIYFKILDLHTRCVPLLLHSLPAGVPSAARRVMLDVWLLWHANGFGGSSLRCFKAGGDTTDVSWWRFKGPILGQNCLDFYFFFFSKEENVSLAPVSLYM